MRQLIIGVTSCWGYLRWQVVICMSESGGSVASLCDGCILAIRDLNNPIPEKGRPCMLLPVVRFVEFDSTALVVDRHEEAGPFI